jgi:hypothetical protein
MSISDQARKQIVAHLDKTGGRPPKDTSTCTNPRTTRVPDRH